MKTAPRSLPMRILTAVFAVVICAGGLGLLFSSPTQAATGSTVNIRSVDSRDFPVVRATAMAGGVDSSTNNVKIVENGQSVNATVDSAAEKQLPTAIVLALDTSAAARDTDALQQEKDAAISMMQHSSKGQQFAIVAYNTTGRLVANFSNDVPSLVGVVSGLQGSGESAMYDGIRVATSVLQSNPDLQPNIVVMNASSDTASDSKAGEALAGLQDSSTSLFAATVTSAPKNESAALKQLAEATHGRAYELSNPAGLTQVLSGVQSLLANQAVVEYTSKSKPGALDIAISIGGATNVAHVASNTLSVGAATTPEIAKVRDLGIFGGPLGMVLLGLIAVTAVAMLVYAISEVLGMDRNQLSRALRPYNTDVDKEETRDFSRLADTEFIKKAVAETAKLAEKRGVLERVQLRLDQAEVPLKPAEVLFFTLAAAVVAMMLGGLLLGFMGFIVGGALFGALPFMILSFKAKQRRKKFTSQLPDTLSLLAGSLRAGYSLIQGVDAVAKQVEAPMGTELTRALAEARLGRPVEDALQDISDRMSSDDFEWAVMAIKIQREVGGNLAELLMTVSHTMVERERLRREVRALTAEGRMSAVILVALPPALTALLTVINPDYIQPMFSTLIGQILLVVATFSVGIGYFLMNKIVQIEA